MKLTVSVTGLALLVLAATGCEGYGARPPALDTTTAPRAESPALVDPAGVLLPGP